MRVVKLRTEDDFDGWRAAARTLAAARVLPSDIIWQVGAQPTDLFATEEVAIGGTPPFTVSKQFLSLASRVALHSDPERFTLLYTLLLRVLDCPSILCDRADPQVRRIEGLSLTIRRDIHKMRAYVRFREVLEGKMTRYVAWFEPEHHILRANAAFFVGRFTNMRWSILTPRGTIHWDGAVLSEGPPAHRADIPCRDPTEIVWKSYYAAIFNPARLMTGAMLKEMPKKYWKNMPETALVPDLIAGARKRELRMIERAHAIPNVMHRTDTVDLLRAEAASCRRCPLWRPATQIIFGEGPPNADIMVVGEQPGNQEDKTGCVFVGPAGQVFDRALIAAGIDRSQLYVTNAVKHFKFELRGKQRIHARPNVTEIDACRWWIDQERALVRPKLIIAMGATAARSLLEHPVRIADCRGSAIALPDGTPCWITVHPSALLRLPDGVDMEAEFDRYVTDLRLAVRSLDR
ncbi:phage SPO1 DNA polymerase-like protein [Neokomagataea thailandica NBRC 106555]|uniref:Type-4 uracil-DNA glycosylase n=2 Tax=Neokomagataea TaxID=1223423 RepID=A0A4Y6V7K9_9PROT|nr:MULTISPECIES: UdgX family uracil-DNA binding protein [Neokomagataea]QDH26022.1 DUF4130 domain-containing protein [Neokomagataea tanensis]GBR51030.1 phage SPO1 DNA polymerase-like protein [Neokomagataea thailandica NBRC 106555]